MHAPRIICACVLVCLCACVLVVSESSPFLGSPRSVMTRTFTTCPTVEKTWRNLSSVVELLTFPMKICHFESPDMVARWLG